MARKPRKGNLTTSLKRASGRRVSKKRVSSGLVSRALETLIVIGFALAVVYAASFAAKVSNGVSKTRPVPEVSLRVQILNGCGERGSAGKVAEALKSKVQLPLEVSVVNVDNFTVYDIEKSFLISRTKHVEDTRLLADQLGLFRDDIIYAPLEDNYRSIQVTLVVGRDYEDKFLK
jgi:LytR cell envelope-related transcriptional attenuator